VVISYTDYYPFGAPMAERAWQGDYRFGFQGQEQDKEMWEGAVSFKYRVEDARLGRFFSVDPLHGNFPYYTPYQFAGNTPIEAKELEGLEPSHTAVKSPAEGKSEATLEDVDVASDVQDQTYCVVFNNVSQEKFQEVSDKFSTDPGSIINNDRAAYRLVDRDGSYGITTGDHFDITIECAPDGFVVVKAEIQTPNAVSVQVQTLKGHPDAGTNTFSMCFDPVTQTVTWQTSNISRTNDNIAGGLGAGIMQAREKQQEQWEDVAVKVHLALGMPDVQMAIADIQEFEYCDIFNKVGAREADECFIKDFSSAFPKKNP